MSWKQAWDEKRTPWDAGASPPILEELVERGTLPAGLALVPGCGSGYDVLTLASNDRRVVGLDLASGARERFETLRQERGVPPDRAEVRVGDFFELELDTEVDMVWDYTFLCAIEPKMRQAWVEKMHQLLAPGGELVTLIFPVRTVDKRPPTDAEGPPYPMHPELVRELVTPLFDKIALDPVETSVESRQGMEWLGRWSPKY